MSSLDNAEKGLYEKISERYETAHAAFRAFAEKGSALSGEKRNFFFVGEDDSE